MYINEKTSSLSELRLQFTQYRQGQFWPIYPKKYLLVFWCKHANEYEELIFLVA